MPLGPVSLRNRVGLALLLSLVLGGASSPGELPPRGDDSRGGPRIIEIHPMDAALNDDTGQMEPASLEITVDLAEPALVVIDWDSGEPAEVLKAGAGRQVLWTQHQYQTAGSYRIRVWVETAGVVGAQHVAAVYAGTSICRLDKLELQTVGSQAHDSEVNGLQVAVAGRFLGGFEFSLWQDAKFLGCIDADGVSFLPGRHCPSRADADLPLLPANVTRIPWPPRDWKAGDRWRDLEARVRYVSPFGGSQHQVLRFRTRFWLSHASEFKSWIGAETMGTPKSVSP